MRTRETSPLPQTDILRQKIEEETREFLKNGGKIQRVKSGQEAWDKVCKRYKFHNPARV